jgi:hypothetical protein
MLGNTFSLMRSVPLSAKQCGNFAFPPVFYEFSEVEARAEERTDGCCRDNVVIVWVVVCWVALSAREQWRREI